MLTLALRKILSQPLGFCSLKRRDDSGIAGYNNFEFLNKPFNYRTLYRRRAGSEHHAHAFNKGFRLSRDVLDSKFGDLLEFPKKHLSNALTELTVYRANYAIDGLLVER